MLTPIGHQLESSLFSNLKSTRVYFRHPHTAFTNQTICLLSFACEEGCLAFTLLLLTIKFTICLTNEQLDASPGFEAMGTCLASPLCGYLSIGLHFGIYC